MMNTFIKEKKCQNIRRLMFIMQMSRGLVIPNNLIYCYTRYSISVHLITTIQGISNYIRDSHTGHASLKVTFSS